MTWGLDTSVIVRLLSGDPPELAETARQTIAALNAAGEAPVVDDLVIAEAYFALTWHYGISKAVALEALRTLLESGDVICTGNAAKTLKMENLASAKPGFVDRLIHAAYHKRGTNLLTFENATAKLAGVRVLRGTEKRD